MKRPFTDFYSDHDILNAYLLPQPLDTFCHACEEPIGSSHFRIRSASYSTTSILCTKCARTLQADAIKRRNAPRNDRPHMAPLTDAERDMPGNFRKCRKLAKGGQ